MKPCASRSRFVSSCMILATVTPWLSQLGLRQSIQLLSTFPPHTSGTQGIVLAMSFGGLRLSSAGLEPALDRAAYRGFLTVDDWWQQVVHIINYQYSRRDIVLRATNEDGGAHVDPSPSEETKNLQLGIGTLTATSAEGHTTTLNLDNAHFWLIRQFGYEILHSPTLIEAMQSTTQSSTAVHTML
jgi:hypothetical protein